MLWIMDYYWGFNYMKILVMGAGALGSAIGGLLAKQNNEVTFIGRKEHINVIDENGLTISGIWGDHTIKNILTPSPNESIPPQDLILITTKSTDTEKSAHQIKPYLHDNTAIVSLQNGVGNEEILQKTCGVKHVLGGMVIIGFKIVKPGHTAVTVFADNIKIGEMDGKLSDRCKKIAQRFNDASLPTDCVENIESRLWGKLHYNSCLNPLGALLNVNYGKLRNPHSWEII